MKAACLSLSLSFAAKLGRARSASDALFLPVALTSASRTTSTPTYIAKVSIFIPFVHIPPSLPLHAPSSLNPPPSKGLPFDDPKASVSSRPTNPRTRSDRPTSHSAMHDQDFCFRSLVKSERAIPFVPGGLFLDDALPSCFVAVVPRKSDPFKNLAVSSCRRADYGTVNARVGFGNGVFLSVSLSVKGNDGYVLDSAKLLGNNNGDKVDGIEVEEKEKGKVKGSAALNTTKHLWSGAVAAMISRTIVAPLERLKLEYVVRGEQKNLFDLIKTISATQGLKGFWKGNFVNILRTAPFKAINFYAYDTYRNKLLKWSGNEEATNFERFVAGAAAGITATLLCLPMDTIRTKMVAPGGEALGGIIGTFGHMVQTEGFFSLYKGLVPAIVAMAPSGAVFYGVYDILKSAYLHTPEGRKRLKHMKQEGQELNALEQLELGPIRTLLYGAIAGACSEAATYPFEVVRRQLQMQLRTTRLSPLATCVKIVEHGGVPALYAGLIPSLLQVLPSAAISYLVYEFMKIVLKVEST